MTELGTPNLSAAVDFIVRRLAALETEKAELLAELASVRDMLPKFRRSRKQKASNGKPKRQRQPRPDRVSPPAARATEQT